MRFYSQEDRQVSQLSKEIHEQPQVLTRLLDEQTETAAQIASAIRARDVHYAVFAARGTSDNAARYAKYLFGALVELPVALATPSLFSIYHTPPQLHDALVLGVSQSGQSPDVVSVVEEGRRQGALAIAVTNTSDSPLAQAAELVLPLEAGEEKAVAATKTYTAQLAALALLAVQLASDDERLAALRRMPKAVEQTLALEESIAQAAQRYAYATECIVLGRGYNYATAFEIALKLKELTYIIAEPYSPADFRHGPVALIEHGFPVVVVAPQGAVYPDILDLTHELADREAELIVISGQEEPLQLARTPLRLPADLPEWLSPFTCVVPGQLLALYTTLAKGYEPDHPRGLTKVTETR
ncbi:MAG: SIS domain-containing protein [Chloroflexota bacterium]|nr:SIS domain-containing protein [Chloroflexota bacterium]